MWNTEYMKTRTPSFLGIKANQGQVFPQHLQKVVQVQLHPAAEKGRHY